MKQLIKTAILLVVSVFLISCASNNQQNVKSQNNEQKPQVKVEQNPQQQPANIVVEVNDGENSKSNEMGKIMILMYHQFKKEETNDWTRSFDNFRKDLQVLYDKGYRPINLRDYINGNIDVPTGYTPVIFTFDDGTSGEFNLIEQDGRLVANPESAVGIMEEFNKLHPDFKLKGTFFINHTGFFHGKGTPKERLQYLIDKGFEIGNHTVNHVMLNKITSAEKIQSEIGGHVKKTQELIPGYVVDELALPDGISSKTFKEYMYKGEFEGIKYENKAVMLVGANPALSPIAEKLDLMNLPRVRSRGYKPVDYDMYYWLDYFDKNPDERYISDGKTDTFTVPEKYKEAVNEKTAKKIVYMK